MSGNKQQAAATTKPIRAVHDKNTLSQAQNEDFPPTLPGRFSSATTLRENWSAETLVPPGPPVQIVDGSREVLAEMEAIERHERIEAGLEGERMLERCEGKRGFLKSVVKRMEKVLGKGEG